MCTAVAGSLGVDEADLEGERLYALVDGLCVHAALDAGRLPADRIRAVVDRHLDSLGG